MKKDLLSYYFLVGVIGFAILVNWFGVVDLRGFFESEMATAATSSVVTVTASITTSITCATDQATTALGTLDSTTISTSTPNASTTMSCINSNAGCTLNVRDAGGTGTSSNPGLWNSTSSALIESPNAAFNATATLTANTEGFGIRATTTASGSSNLISIVQRYNIATTGGLVGGNDVGGLSTSSIAIASSTGPVNGREIVVYHRAAVSSTTPGGTYADTITYSCTAN